ncbi:MAG: tryptophan synthase subunit alpha [Candidatus Auribacterota bacterium]|jgi:tryptophan synthase alpha chain|nr:tryptophan synthase subunit alpha [Candidatus Auribacterota bacterium]
MTRVDDRFALLKKNGQKGFIAYITAGDPTLEFTERLIIEMDKIGVDVLELGVPFSDPLADGPVIQSAMIRALKNKTNIEKICKMVKQVRKSVSIPIILFSYLNPVYQYGIEKFASDLKDAGIDGALLLDLPVEESSEYCSVMEKYGLNTVFLIAPTTTEQRVRTIAQYSTGFIYYVSRTGVTGERSDVNPEIENKVRLIKSYTDKPVAIGFGVSDPQQARLVAKYGDAVVVGSAVVRRIQEFAEANDGHISVAEFVRSLVTPLHQGA